jgi:hypothetical protein
LVDNQLRRPNVYFFTRFGRLTGITKMQSTFATSNEETYAV